MAMGKHYGSFAKGFMDSILAVYKLKMTKDLYDARAAYYKQRGDAAEQNAANRGNKGAGLANAIEGGKEAWGQGGGGGGGGGGAYEGGPKAEAHAQEMSQYLQDKWGLSKAGAAGVVGNAWQESKFAANFNPGGDKGTAAGMFQWRDTGSGSGARQTNARNYIAQNGLDPNDWRSHLDAAMAETKRDYPSMFNQLRTTDDPQYATHEFFHVFERGDPNQANFANRDGMAQAALGGKPATTQTASATTPTKGPNKGRTPKTATTPVAAPASDDKKAAPAKTAQAGDGSYQVAGDAGPVSAEAAARQKADLEAHRAPSDTRTAQEMDQDSPAPGPGSAPPRSERALTPPEQAPAPPTPNEKIAAIPPGPTVPAQDQQAVPPEANYPTPDSTYRPEDSPDPRSYAAQGPALPPVQGPPQRTGAPPNVGPTPSSVGEDNPLTRNMPVPPVGAGGEYRNMPYVGETASGSQRDPKGVYGPKPVPIAVDTGARPDLTARSPATAANVPSKDAQPVSATAPASNPAGNTGDAAGTVRYEVPNSSASRAPIITVGDLSHLWGPNPPLARAAPSVTPVGNPRQDDGGDWSNVASAPDMSDVALGMQMGAAKGGAIPERPRLGFAAGGAAPVSSQYPSYTPATPKNNNVIQGNVLAADQFMTGLPGMSAVDLTQTNPMYYTSYGPGQGGVGGQTLTSDWSKMTPAQQQQYAAMTAGTWQPPADTSASTATPATTAAAPATVAPTATNIVSPAASSTITDPTTTTTTGAPKLANSVTAKSYDPNVDQQTGAGFSNTSNTGGTDYSVGSDDLLKQNASGQISGSRKGGPIKRYANGGGIPSRPMTRFAAGGGAAASSLMSPNYSGPTAGGGWAGTPYADMAPNQQAWATSQQNLLGQEKANANNPTWSGWAQLSGTPAAIWPAAPAPAAPAPIAEPAPTATNTVAPAATATITDPTTTTTTGAPGLPNSITAKSYDPNVDAQTGAGFANTSNVGGTDYSVGTDDLLQQNASGQISGTNQNNTTILSRKGGPITQRVNRYDDGGGVSPSAAGMPPGLGGQQAIPPIYYNPATYAGAGAPVGKGITQNSATTFNAGAIPSLPMARGGVVGYDDGGGVGDDTLNAMTTMDIADARDEASSPTPAAAPAPTTTYNSVGEPTSDVDPNEFLQPPAASGGGAAKVNPPPPDPTAAEIHDGNGNPSKGLIAAIGDGLHWLGDHLGLVGGAQAAPLASNAQTQTNRQNHVNYGPNSATYMTPKDAEELNDQADPNHELSSAYRNIAGLEAGYKFALSQGDSQTAGRLAASILHYSVITSQNLSAKAQDALYKGDLQKSVDYVNQASDAVPDGRLVHMTLNPDGKTVTVTGSNLSGEALWQKQGSAAAVLERATSMGRDGRLQWNALESQAAKYDSTFAQMQKARQGNEIGRAKEDAANASAGRVAATGAGNPLQPVTRVGNAPPALPGPGSAPAAAPAATPAPAPTPVSASGPASGAAPSPDSRGGAAPATPPAGADSNAPYQPSDLGGAPTQAGPAIPPRATPDANAPAPAAQDVSFEQVASRLNNQEAQANASDAARIRGGYFTPQGNILYGGQEYARPPEPDMTGLNKPEQQQAMEQYVRGPLAQYNAMLKANQDAMNKDIADNRDIRNKQYQTLRDQARDAAAERGRRETFQQQDDRTSQRAVDQSKRDAILNSQKDALDKSNAVFKSNLAGSAPRSDQEMNSLAGEGKTYDPAVMVAQAFNPDLPEDTNRVTAMNDLKQKGFDANTQATLATAWHNAVRNSHGVDPEQVGPAIQSFVTGGPFTATAEAVDANGRPTAQHGEVRYAVTVEDNTGNHISMLMPQNDLSNLRNLRYQYSRQQGANLADTISRKGVLGSMGYGEPGLPPTSIPAWQGRTPAEQTQAPPF